MSAITSVRFILAKDPKGASLGMIMDMLDEDYQPEALRVLTALVGAGQVTESKVSGERWFVLDAPKPQDFIASPGMNIDKYKEAHGRHAKRQPDAAFISPKPEDIQWPNSAPSKPTSRRHGGNIPVSTIALSTEKTMSSNQVVLSPSSSIPEGRRGRLRPECLTGMAAWLLYSKKQDGAYIPISLGEIAEALNVLPHKLMSLKAGLYSMARSGVIKPASGKDVFVWSPDFVFPYPYASDQQRAEAAIAKAKLRADPAPEKSKEAMDRDSGRKQQVQEQPKNSSPVLVSIKPKVSVKPHDQEAQISAMLDQANENFIGLARQYVLTNNETERINLAKLIGRIDALNELLAVEESGAISSAG